MTVRLLQLMHTRDLPLWSRYFTLVDAQDADDAEGNEEQEEKRPRQLA